MDLAHLTTIASYLGAALGVGISSIGAGMGEGYIAGHATYAIMRQPKSRDVLLRTMLISQAVTETGAIFALVIAILMMFGGIIDPNGSLQSISALLGAGITIGAGTVGSGIGKGYAGGIGCKAVARNPKMSKQVTADMLIGQALSETSSIFALVISMLLLYSTPVGNSIVKTSSYLGAAFAIGMGTFGPAIGIGVVAGKTLDGISRFPRQSAALLRTMFVGAAVSESTSIYALVIAFLLIFIV